MTPLEPSISDATIWSVTLESSVTILKGSIALIYDVNSTGVTYGDRQLTIVICLYYRPLIYKSNFPVLISLDTIM